MISYVPEQLQQSISAVQLTAPATGHLSAAVGRGRGRGGGGGRFWQQDSTSACIQQG